MKYIDNVDFAKKEQSLSGTVDAAKWKRASEMFEAISGNIHYSITGLVDQKNKPILKLVIYGKITTLCQNCLEKMDIDVDYHNSIPVYYTESDMDNALFGNESEYSDGVLADAHFDIENFIEDELIMLLPIAPKHDACNTITYQDKPDSPFSVLIK
jgi:uncharacterized protein